MTLRSLREGTVFGGDVPPGEYAVSFVSGGGRRASAKGNGVPVGVRAGAVARALLAVTEPGFLSFSCLEPLGLARALSRVPCRVTLAGLGTTPAPEVASPFATGPRNQLTRADGRIAIAIAPGKYRVTASRGPSFSVAEWEIDVTPGTTTWGPREGAAVLRRVVDTHGYLAVDLGVPAASGADAAALIREAVVAEAADGVDVVARELEATVHEAKLDATLGWAARDPDAVDAWTAPESFLPGLAASQAATAFAGAGARVYVRVDDDGPVAGWRLEREADLARGIGERKDVVLTNGPFLRVAANDAPIGGIARARPDHDVEVKVHVECGPSQTVDRLTVLRASGLVQSSQPVVLRAAPSGARVADATFHLRATADDAFVVTADGPAPSGPGGALAPRAMTGAIWIDADGDGKSLGRTPPPRSPPPLAEPPDGGSAPRAAASAPKERSP
jgi:hypothetical protein